MKSRTAAQSWVSRSSYYRFTFLYLSFRHLFQNTQIVKVLWISTHQTLLIGRFHGFFVNGFLRMALVDYRIANKCHDFHHSCRCCIIITLLWFSYVGKIPDDRRWMFPDRPRFCWLMKRYPRLSGMVIDKSGESGAFVFSRRVPDFCDGGRSFPTRWISII